MRINRADLPNITDPDQPFEIGKAYEVKAGSDAVIYTMGVTTSIALEAAELLEKEGISLKVVNVSTLKPLADEEILKYAEGMKAIVTFEEHSIIGGLNSIVCQAVAGKFCGPIKGIAIPDKFGFSTKSYQELMDFFGLNKENVIAKVKEALGK